MFQQCVAKQHYCGTFSPSHCVFAPTRRPSFFGAGSRGLRAPSLPMPLSLVGASSSWLRFPCTNFYTDRPRLRHLPGSSRTSRQEWAMSSCTLHVFTSRDSTTLPWRHQQRVWTTDPVSGCSHLVSKPQEFNCFTDRLLDPGDQNLSYWTTLQRNASVSVSAPCAGSRPG